MRYTSDLFRFLSLFAVFLVFAGLAIGIGFVKGCFRSMSDADLAKEVREASPTFHISSIAFVKEYLADETSANAKYNGKIGTVVGLRQDLTKRPLANISRLNGAALQGNERWTVRCFWAIDKDASRGLHLTAPYYILKGKVEGMNARRLTIDLHGCFVQHPP